MRSIGLHIRDNTSLQDIQQKISLFNLTICQMFVVAQQTGKLCTFTHDEIRTFAQFVENSLERLYVHGSYWINLAGLIHNGYHAFKREFSLAKRLHATHFIIHPGTAKGTIERIAGIDALAHVINMLVKTEQDITIVLENTAHGKLTVGSDLYDFYLLRQKLNVPERVQFCIDTAHAYAFGYNISDNTYQDTFITDLERYIGLNNIELIHLNDTNEYCGSKIDCHEVPGAGNIGVQALLRFCNNVCLAQKSVIFELPVLSLEQEYEVFKDLTAKMYREDS